MSTYNPKEFEKFEEFEENLPEPEYVEEDSFINSVER